MKKEGDWFELINFLGMEEKSRKEKYTVHKYLEVDILQK